jgi:hypothetical protein
MMLKVCRSLQAPAGQEKIKFGLRKVAGNVHCVLRWGAPLQWWAPRARVVHRIAVDTRSGATLVGNGPRVKGPIPQESDAAIALIRWLFGRLVESPHDLQLSNANAPPSAEAENGAF